MFTTTRSVRARYLLQADAPLARVLDILYTTMINVCKARRRFPPVLLEGTVLGAFGQTVRFRGEDGILQIQGSLPSANGTLIMRMVFEDASNVDVHMMGEVRRQLSYRNITLGNLPGIPKEESGDEPAPAHPLITQEEPNDINDMRREIILDMRGKISEAEQTGENDAAAGRLDGQAPQTPPQIPSRDTVADAVAMDGQKSEIVAVGKPERPSSWRTNLLLITLFILLLAAAWMYFRRPASAPPPQSGEIPKLLSFTNSQMLENPYVQEMYRMLENVWDGRVGIEIVNGDGETGLLGEYYVNIIPTQIVLDSSGEEIARQEGPIDAEGLQQLLVQALFSQRKQ